MVDQTHQQCTLSARVLEVVATLRPAVHEGLGNKGPPHGQRVREKRERERERERAKDTLRARERHYARERRERERGREKKERRRRSGREPQRERVCETNLD
jgi:hypothetical protein